MVNAKRQKAKGTKAKQWRSAVVFNEWTNKRTTITTNNNNNNAPHSNQINDRDRERENSNSNERRSDDDDDDDDHDVSVFLHLFSRLHIFFLLFFTFVLFFAFAFVYFLIFVVLFCFNFYLHMKYHSSDVLCASPAAAAWVGFCLFLHIQMHVQKCTNVTVRQTDTHTEYKSTAIS